MAGVGPTSSLAVGGKTTPTCTGTWGETLASGQNQGRNGDVEKRIGPAYTLELSAAALSGRTDPETRRLKRTGAIECQTCKTRKYQDISNDPGVSFKAPGHISPGSSASVVHAHEQEHVSNEQAAARSEGRKVVSQTVRLFTSVCPECGRAYVSGGETRTVTAADTQPQQSAAAEPASNSLDLAV